MTYGEPQIAVWIGNYGYYAEGELRDRRVELPMRDEDLDAFLREAGLLDAQHEEIYISDYDGIPLGMPYGEAFSEYTHLDDLNLLAKQMDLASPSTLEAVEGALGAMAEPPQTVVELMNLIAQADEIPFAEWPDELDYSSPEERLAYAIAGEVGGVERLDRSTLEAHFDYASYGRLLADEGIAIGDDGYLDAPAQDDLTGRYGAEEVIEEAELLGWDGSVPSPDELEEARTTLADVGAPAPDDAEPRLVAAAAAVVEDLDARGYEALELYAQHCMGSLDGPAELASAALQVDDIMYREYLRPLAADPYEGLARTVVDEFGGIAQLGREALEAHFDWETWGRELAMGFSLGERGYLDAAADMPDLGTYSRGELAEEIEPEWELERAPELATEPVMAAVALPQRQEARTSPTPAGDEVSARAQSRALSQQRAQSPRARTRQ